MMLKKLLVVTLMGASCISTQIQSVDYTLPEKPRNNNRLGIINLSELKDWPTTFERIKQEEQKFIQYEKNNSQKKINYIFVNLTNIFQSTVEIRQHEKEISFHPRPELIEQINSCASLKSKIIWQVNHIPENRNDIKITIAKLKKIGIDTTAFSLYDIPVTIWNARLKDLMHYEDGILFAKNDLFNELHINWYSQVVCIDNLIFLTDKNIDITTYNNQTFSREKIKNIIFCSSEFLKPSTPEIYARCEDPATPAEEKNGYFDWNKLDNDMDSMPSFAKTILENTSDDNLCLILPMMANPSFKEAALFPRIGGKCFNLMTELKTLEAKLNEGTKIVPQIRIDLVDLFAPESVAVYQEMWSAINKGTRNDYKLNTPIARAYVDKLKIVDPELPALLTRLRTKHNINILFVCSDIPFGPSAASQEPKDLIYNLAIADAGADEALTIIEHLHSIGIQTQEFNMFKSILRTHDQSNLFLYCHGVLFVNGKIIDENLYNKVICILNSITTEIHDQKQTDFHN